MKWAAVLVIVAAVACASALGELPSVLLESAKYQENTAKNPEAAAKIYEQIIADVEANRPAAAEAHYRLGMIYMNKGEKEKGIAELKKVVEQYADQASVAGTAKVLLARQGKPAGAPASGKPKILSTTPVALATDVDPSLTAITVAFDQRMRDQSWSWTGGGETYPTTTGKPSYDSARTTCTMPVKLEPGKAYWIGINSPSHKNFASANNVPADWYAIAFATKDKDGNPTPIPDDLLQRAKQINGTHSLSGGASAYCISASPAEFSNDVEPSVTEIKVTFDREMADKSWSWTRDAKETFPQTTGEPSYDAARTTCTLPVKLEPGKVYWVGLNYPPRFMGFQGKAGEIAKSHILLFATKSADGQPTPIPDDMLQRATEINAANVPPASNGNILKNSGAEEGQDYAAAWESGNEVPGVEYLWDRETGFNGGSSLCLNKTAQNYFPIAEWRQQVEREGNLPAIKVSALVKTENLTKAVLDVLFLDENSQWIMHKWAGYIGPKGAGDPPQTKDWQEYSDRIDIPQNTKYIVVGLQIYGPGKVWFDNIEAVYTE